MECPDNAFKHSATFIVFIFHKRTTTLAGRSRSTFGKRQKEQKRQEKRLEKVARKDQRKQDKAAGIYTDSDDQPLPDELFVDDPSHDEAP